MLSILSALFSSCGNNYLTHGSEISVRTKNGEQKDYKLLSVRDSSLVVIDAKEDIAIPAFSHAEVIRNDSIYKIYRTGTPGASQYFLGGAAGFGIGALVGTVFNPQPQSGIKTFTREMNAGAIGMVCGMIISAFIPPNDKQLHPIYKKDKEFLRSISRFPGGEPEMLKLVR